MPEAAVKHSYDARENKWTKCRVSVDLEPRPFSEGCLRRAHKMWEYDTQGRQGGRTAFVAKFNKVELRGGPKAERDSCFGDVKTQMVAELYAQEFNKRKPRSKVAFVPAYVLELTDRPGAPCCCIEPYLDGPYCKHNNNDGDVASKRDTPQAFSHFTYEHSKHKLLVCDIQGVADFYTDPQIHSLDGLGYGLGNMGRDGISKFLMTHKCKDECQRVGLAPAASTRMPSNPEAKFSNGQWGLAPGRRAAGGAGKCQDERLAAKAAPGANRAQPKGPSTRLAEQFARMEGAAGNPTLVVDATPTREEDKKWQAIDARLARQLSMEEHARR